MMVEVAVCQICNQTEEWHVEHGVKHAFSPDSTRFKLAEPKQQQKVMLPGDPVLRMVLVRKGIISPEELASVEKELASAGIITSDPVDKSRGDEEPVRNRGREGAERGLRASIAQHPTKGGRATQHK